jgi:hypothetical protein
MVGAVQRGESCASVGESPLGRGGILDWTHGWKLQECAGDLGEARNGEWDQANQRVEGVDLGCLTNEISTSNSSYSLARQSIVEISEIQLNSSGLSNSSLLSKVKFVDVNDIELRSASPSDGVTNENLSPSVGSSVSIQFNFDFARTQSDPDFCLANSQFLDSG